MRSDRIWETFTHERERVMTFLAIASTADHYCDLDFVDYTTLPNPLSEPIIHSPSTAANVLERYF